MSVTGAGDRPSEKSAEPVSSPRITAEQMDEAAKFVMKLRGDAVWDCTSEVLRERQRDKVRHILLLCGVDPSAWAVKK
jgi:hypothetical protein